jgi:hypothetical protein
MTRKPVIGLLVERRKSGSWYYQAIEMGYEIVDGGHQCWGGRIAEH